MEITTKQVENNLKLSIQVSLDGLSFCALDQSGQKIVFFRDLVFPRKLNPIEVLEEIEKVYEEETFLSTRPREVEVLFSNELYSIVPEKFFNEKNASDYLKFNTKILTTDFVAQDYLRHKLVNVYIPYTNINNYFFDTYGEFQYRHCLSVLVDELLSMNEDQKDANKVYLNSTAAGYDLVVISNGELLLANSFHCETKEDFIYYLLFTAEQLDLDPHSLELVLLGRIMEESDTYKIVYNYVRNIEILDITFGFSFEAESKPPKAYQHFTLLKSVQ